MSTRSRRRNLGRVCGRKARRLYSDRHQPRSRRLPLFRLSKVKHNTVDSTMVNIPGQRTFVVDIASLHVIGDYIFGIAVDAGLMQLPLLHR